MNLTIGENGLTVRFLTNSKNQFCLDYMGLTENYPNTAGSDNSNDQFKPAFHIGTVPGHGFLGKKFGSESESYIYSSHNEYQNKFGKKIEIVLNGKDLEVTLHYQFFSGINALQTYTEVKNISQSNRLLLYITSFHLSNIEYPEKIMSVNNGWCSESDAHFFSPADLGLVKKSHGMPSKRIFISNIGTQSTKDYLPVGYIDGMFWQIESNTSWEWEIADCGELYLSLSGPSDETGWHKTLAPGQTFSSVKSAVAFGKDFNEVIAEITKYRRIIKGKNSAFLKQPVIFNDFNNCLMAEPTYEKEIPCIDAAAEIGAEYYCVDGGWFSDGSWWDGVGEWKESRARFHGKLKEVFNYIIEKGMRPGIWLEPEVMGIHCPVAASFSDDCFFMRHGKRVIHRNRYQFDFRNKRVTEYLSSVVDRLVNDYNIKFFKFDYNIDAGVGTELNSDSFGDGLSEHGKAMLNWVRSIMDKYPEIIIESCASGGMRMDYSTLSVFHLQSTSDQENYIDTSLVSANSPIGLLPEQAGVWSYPLACQDTNGIIFNMLNSMRNCMYISGEVMKLSSEQLATVKTAVSLYKEIRDDIKISIPFFPLGISSYNNPLRCVGYDSGGKKYIILWNCSDKATKTAINISGGSVKSVYPLNTKVIPLENELEISLDKASACMIIYS